MNLFNLVWLVTTAGIIGAVVYLVSPFGPSWNPLLAFGLGWFWGLLAYKSGLRIFKDTPQ